MLSTYSELIFFFKQWLLISGFFLSPSPFLLHCFITVLLSFLHACCGRSTPYLHSAHAVGQPVRCSAERTDHPRKSWNTASNPAAWSSAIGPYTRLNSPFALAPGQMIVSMPGACSTSSSSSNGCPPWILGVFIWPSQPCGGRASGETASAVPHSRLEEYSVHSLESVLRAIMH